VPKIDRAPSTLIRHTSRGLSVVEAEKAAEPFPTADLSNTVRRLRVEELPRNSAMAILRSAVSDRFKYW
jgi:hypothetical protein